MYNNNEMAPMAYTYLMWLTYDWYLSDSPTQKDNFKALADRFRANQYLTTKGENKIVDAGIEYMLTKPDSDITMEQHYFRNQLNIQYEWSDFGKLQRRLPDNLKWNGNVLSGFHQNNTVNRPFSNRKYVSFDGYFELIFNDDNVLQTQYNNPDDMGTYNYYNPTTQSDLHFKYDVSPYGLIRRKWGNIKNEG